MSEAKFIGCPVEDKRPEEVEHEQIDPCEFIREEFERSTMPEGQEEDEGGYLSISLIALE